MVEISGMLGGMGETAGKFLYIAVLFIIGLIFVGIMGGVAYFVAVYKTYSKYHVVIFDRRRKKDGHEHLFWVGTDKGGIVKDRKLKKHFFRMQKNRFHFQPQVDSKTGEFDIPSIPNLKGGEVVFVERLAPKKFVFLEMGDIKGSIDMQVTEEDKAEALREFDLNAKLYGNPTKALIIAISVIAITGIIIGLMWLMNGKQLAEVAQIFKETLPVAKDYALSAKGSTIPSGVPA